MKSSKIQSPNAEQLAALRWESAQVVTPFWNALFASVRHVLSGIFLRLWRFVLPGIFQRLSFVLSGRFSSKVRASWYIWPRKFVLPGIFVAVSLIPTYVSGGVKINV